MKEFDYAYWCGRLYAALLEANPESNAAAEYEDACLQETARRILEPLGNDAVEGHVRDWIK